MVLFGKVDFVPVAAGAVVAERRTHAQQSVMVDTGEVCHESWQHVNASRKEW